MMVYLGEGKTEEIALQKGLEEANASSKEVLYRTKEIPGTLLKKTKYQVRVVTLQEIREEIESFLNEFAHLMNIRIDATVKEEDHIFKVTLDSDHNSILIGKDGKTMKAVQVLLRQMLLSKIGMPVKIDVDVSGYKEKKMKQIENMARRIASEVIHTKIETKLDSMNSYERRFVHNIISEYTMLETHSIGEEPNRQIVISYKQDL
ncbi:MAG: KH domain-containing protein [Bacilli bacterium]|nr:KH domain-containing protein [Bacilli bacterium]